MTFVASSKSIAVGLFAGLAAAVLVLSPVGGSFLAVPLTALVDLPLVIAALGWGTTSGIVAVFAGGGTLLAISAPLALYFLVFQAPAALIGSYLIGLARERQAADGSTAVPVLEWYPLGRMALRVAFVVVAGAIVLCVIEGFDPSALTPGQIRSLASTYSALMTELDDTMPRDQLTDLISPAITVMLRILPFAFVMTWTLIVVFNLGLGLWITVKSGNLHRPRDDSALVDIPTVILPILVVTFVIGLLPGTIGALSLAVAGAMAGLLLLTGLIVLHAVTRGKPFRLPLLILVYAFLGIFGLPLVILGSLEPYAQLRSRFMAPRPPVPPVTHG